jgi:MATE family multidrug resistance protein
MVPLSIGLAAATRVGNLIGENNPRQAKVASYSTIYMCMFTALLNSIVILIFREYIVGFYTVDPLVFDLGCQFINICSNFSITRWDSNGRSWKLKRL